MSAPETVLETPSQRASFGLVRGVSRPLLQPFGLASEAIPGEPSKSEIPSEWIHSFAAAAAKAFLTCD
jgi:hypothetical protein